VHLFDILPAILSRKVGKGLCGVLIGLCTKSHAFAVLRIKVIIVGYE